MIPMTNRVGFASRQSSATRSQVQTVANVRNKPAPELTIQASQRRVLKAQENLFMQGDEIRSVYILHEGWAFRYQCLEDGRRQIVDFILPGDVLGVGAGAQMLYGVEALTTCTWGIVPRQSFMSGLRDQPTLSAKLLEMLAQAQARAFDQMTSVGRRTARERVSHLLLDLARRIRASDCAHVEIAMPLMLSHIGDALGLATETVCRCLSDLKRARILTFTAGRLEILDLEGLSEIAGSTVEDSYPEDRSRSRIAA